MARDQNPARENFRRLAELKGWSIKGIAERAGLGVSTLYNWLLENNPNDLSGESLNRVADVFGLTIEQMFYYNDGHEQAGAPPQAPEDWREQIREIERYVRSIEDPIERLATVRRLLAIARTDVEVYERSLDRGADARAAAPGAAPAPGTTRGRFGRQVK